VAVSAGNESNSVLDFPAQQETIIQHFNQITAGNIMKMSYLHPEENDYFFDDADALVDWASANGLSVHGHTFIWHSDYQVPDWMTGYGGDFAALLNDHVTTIASHFADTVVESWDVVNEGIDETEDDCYRDSLFYQRVGADYIENAFRAADAADPDAELYYNDYSIEDGNSDKFACLLQIVEGLLADSVPIDGVGFQMHVQIDSPDTGAMAIAFQEIVDLGLKVKITEMDVPLNNPYSGEPFPQYTEFTAAEAELQKQRYHDIVETYLDVVPVDQRGGITVWGLWDSDSWLLSMPERAGSDDWPLLFTAPGPEGPFAPKPALQGFGDALMGM
ncbi:MAG TPA: endo-1,4-beta-xylanase, partial [Gammaproteobacteria bacterium]